MGAILAWYWATDASPVDRLSRAEITAFRDHLVRRGLAASTIRAYLKGARSLFDALHAARGDLPPLDHPFRGLARVEKVHSGAQGVPLSSDSSGDVRLDLLNALVAQGFSVAEACRLTWRDVAADSQVVTVVRRGVSVEVALSQDARLLLGDFSRRGERVLGWGPDHARRMLRAT